MPARAIALATSLAVAGCATSQPPIAGLPARAQSRASVLAPVGEPAARYNDAAPRPPASRLLARLVDTTARVAERSGKPAPAPDGRLFAVATDLAGIIGDGPPPLEAVSFVLSYHGIIEPSAHLIVIRSEKGDDDGIAAELEARLPAVVATTSFARIGAGVAPTGGRSRTVVVALQECALETEPIPRELPVGGSLRLRGRILLPYTDPKVIAAGPDGAVTNETLARDHTGGFSVELRCEKIGRLKVEIVGEDRPRNATVLASFTVFCGEPAPRTLALAASSSAPSDARAVERDLFERLNGDRARAGLELLTPDTRAADIARRHSEEMRDMDYVGNVSPTTGTARDRARAGGLATPLLLESAARSHSAADVEAGLIDSPGNRANLLSPLATHVGIGVALGDVVGNQHEIYVTELFFRLTPLMGPAAARDEVLKVLVKTRGEAHLNPVIEDPALREVADQYAAALAAGKSREDAAAQADVALHRLADRFRRVTTMVSIFGDPYNIRADPALDASALAFGLGVAQGRHPDFGDGAFYIVILVARNQ